MQWDVYWVHADPKSIFGWEFLKKETNKPRVQLRVFSFLLSDSPYLHHTGWVWTCWVRRTPLHTWSRSPFLHMCSDTWPCSPSPPDWRGKGTQWNCYPLQHLGPHGLGPLEIWDTVNRYKVILMGRVSGCSAAHSGGRWIVCWISTDRVHFTTGKCKSACFHWCPPVSHMNQLEVSVSLFKQYDTVRHTQI